MPIPDYQSLMLPLLELMADGQERSLRDAIKSVADRLSLTEDERRELLPSGRQAVFTNRVSWANHFMKMAGLIESTKRGYIKITEEGLRVIKQKPDKINNKFLEKYPSFVEFRNSGREKTQVVHHEQEPSVEQSPEEMISIGYIKIRQQLARDILDQIKLCSPEFFERLVVELLVAMGYGGSMADAGRAVGKSGDGGIDGIIKEDRLGLDAIYIQAKRWDGTVGRPEVQKFAGALQGHRAKKGVFITTSAFTKDATEFVERVEGKIVLIDGVRLADLMIDFNIGVTKVASYELKRIDSDYFTDE